MIDFRNIVNWFINNGSTRVMKAWLNGDLVWMHSYRNEPFFIHNNKSQAQTISIQRIGTRSGGVSVVVSSNKRDWTTLGTASVGNPVTFTIQPGEIVYMRSNKPSGWGDNENNYVSITGCSCVGGNILSLLYGSNFTPGVTTFPSGSTYAYQFCGLFANNTTLEDAGLLALPSDTKEACYYGMFEGCTSLVNTPILPAMTMSLRSYYRMFKGCTSLTTIPSLPADTLAHACYNGMFSGCTSLQTVSEPLKARELAEFCYGGMFKGCTSLIAGPDIWGATAYEGSFQGMFEGCTSMTTSPLIYTQGAQYHSFISMFKDCTNITKIYCNVKYAHEHAFNDQDYYSWMYNTPEYGTIYLRPDREDEAPHYNWVVVNYVFDEPWNN